MKLEKRKLYQAKKKGGSQNLKKFPAFFSLLIGTLFLCQMPAVFSQSVTALPSASPVRLTSEEIITTDGLAIEQLVERGADRRADLQAARARLAIAEGKLLQARARPNPTFDTEFGSSKILGGESEYDFSAGVSQTFELGGKRAKRTAVAELELQQIRAEVLALERRLATEIRASYTKAIAAARQLDVLERLIAANSEIVRAAEARLKEGDVAPLDVNLVKVEADTLKIKIIQARRDLETAVLELKTLTGADVTDDLRLAPQSDKPPRLDLGLNELTEIALRDRADLQAAQLAERIGAARVNLARADAVPNLTGLVRFSRSKGIFDLPDRLGGGLLTDTDNELTVGVSIDIPIFNRNRGAIAAATGEQIQAARSREFLEATIRRDVAVALRKYRAAAETLTIYAVQIIPRSEENLKAVQAAYGFGEFSVFEVVNEQRRLVDNVTNYNQSLREYYDALNELETALGTTIPPTGLSPVSSILPANEIAPRQFSRENFLKSVETVDFRKRLAFPSNETPKATANKTPNKTQEEKEQ